MKSVWDNWQLGASHCDGCPGQSAPYPFSGIGNEKADLMLVGMEPAYNVDDDTVDPEMTWLEAKHTMEENRRESLNPLWKHMMNIALVAKCSPEHLYFTNLSKCSTSDASFEECFEQCRGYLPREIGHVDPEALLLHGSNVIDVIFDMFGIEWSGTVGDVHGEIFETNGLKLVTLYHWGYAYRQGNIESYNDEVAEVVQEVL